MLMIYLIVACYQYFTWVFHCDFMNFGGILFFIKGGKSNTLNTRHDFAHINKSERIFVTKLPSANVTQKLFPSYFTISYYTSLADRVRPIPTWRLWLIRRPCNKRDKEYICKLFIPTSLFSLFAVFSVKKNLLVANSLNPTYSSILRVHFCVHIIASWIPMILLVWVGHSAVIRVQKCACVKLTLKGYSRYITTPPPSHRARRGGRTCVALFIHFYGSA